jgi:putative hydrolase of the HAD superfamily
MKLLLVDLDCTLYPQENELFSLMGLRISQYIRSTLCVSRSRANELRDFYWKKYGLTLIGLIKHHDVIAEDFLHYIHDIDIQKKIQPNPKLNDQLISISIPKILFTNSCRYYAKKVLSVLRLTNCFEDIIDIREMNLSPKPDSFGYQLIMNRYNINGDQCMMVDDSLDNLQTATSLKMKTIWVGRGKKPSEIDGQAKFPNDIPDVVCQLIDQSYEPLRLNLMDALQ